MSAAEEKRLLRARLRAEPPGGSSAALCRRILTHPWYQAAGTVMAYMAMPSEPDLAAVLEAAKAAGKRLVLPRCEPDGTMTARADGPLRPGPFGILEPEGPPVPPEEIDLVLTPGLAFDRQGGRLGRGKGYYDRFLAGFAGRTMGICYHGALLERVPMDGHDRRMDAVVTDETTLTFGRTEGDFETQTRRG